MATDPAIPVPISYIGSRYLIFDINAVTWLRRVHHICGVMSGTLPQSPSQNIFLGLPIQIMPEEAQLLVEKGAAFILDDPAAHDRALFNGDTSRQAAYRDRLVKKGEQVSIARNEEREEITRRKLKAKGVKVKSKDGSLLESDASASTQGGIANLTIKDETDESLFDSSPSQRSEPSNSGRQLQPHGIVPTTSELWIDPMTSNPESMSLLPNVPPSYALYKHLISKGYFVTPGLRFGCQYSVYPGDPLRFHAHFLAVGFTWDQEINLMDIVGGGRLGTGVKKGFLIGGREPPKSAETGQENNDEGNVRTFSVEWAAM